VSKLLIVTDGLVPSGDSVCLHPALNFWQKRLEGCSQRWFSSIPKTAIEWYAELTMCDYGRLLMKMPGKEQLEGFGQLWIASPYHARLTRDRLQVMPDALFSWSENDALRLCDLLNPLLAEDGMKLVSRQSILFLLCTNALDANPVSFASVSGHTLPDRHPEGIDGGALMRLTAEIQMMLNQHPSEERRKAGEADVDGLWLWGASPIRDEAVAATVPVATRNPLLRALADARGAEMIISEADRLTELIMPEQPLPARIVLAGSGCAVMLRKSYLPKFGNVSWFPKSVMDESVLFERIRR